MVSVREAPVLLLSTRARLQPVGQTGESRSQEFPREAPPASGAVLPSDYHPGGEGPAGTLSQGISVQTVAPRTITLSMLNTLPFEQILETSSVILRVSSLEFSRGYRVKNPWASLSLTRGGFWGLHAEPVVV